MSAYHPFSADRTRDHVDSGVDVILRYGELMMALDRIAEYPVVSNDDRTATVQAQLVEAGEAVGQFFSTRPRARFKQFVAVKNEPSRIDMRRVRIVAMLAARLVYRDLGRTDIMEVARSCARAGGDLSPSAILEYRRLITVACVEGLLDMQPDPMNGVGLVEFASVVRITLLGGKSCLGHVDSGRMGELRSQLRATGAGKTGDKMVAPAGADTPVPHDLVTAHAIYDRMRLDVVGQDDLVRQLSTTAYLHIQRINLARKNTAVNLPPTCTLMIGASGTGKTYSAMSLSRILGLPFAALDLTSCTASGYVGVDVQDDALRQLIRNTGDPADRNTITRAQTGILFLDEICKKRAQPHATSVDIGGAGIQNELLKMIEGHKVIIGNTRRMREENPQQFDTTNLFFIFAGAFSGLAESIGQMTKREVGGIGFGASRDGTRQQALLQDAIIEYGFLPELVNRFTSILVFKPLTPGQLVAIATLPGTGVIASFNRFLAHQSINIGVAPAAMGRIAASCCDRGLHARGLKFIISAMVNDAVFDGRTGEVIFTMKDVTRALEKIFASEMCFAKAAC